MIKRIISVLLVLVMLSAAGCSRVEVHNDSTDSTGSAGDTSEVTATLTETAASPETEPETTEEQTEPVPDDIGIPGEPEPSSTQYPAVLCYHLVLDEPYTELDSLFVHPSDFEDHLQKLTDAGYTFLFASEYGPVENKSVVLTFDDGYIDNYNNMFPILKKYNAKATVFMIGNLIDDERYLSKDMLLEMSNSGYVEIGSHTYYHVDMSQADEEQMEREMFEGKDTLEHLLGKEVNSFAYPCGGYNDTAMAVAKKYYTHAFTTQYGFLTTESYMDIPRMYVSRDVKGDAVLAMVGN